MQRNLFFYLSLLLLAACKSPASLSTGATSYTPVTVPKDVKGDFKDDYGISYTINDSVWIQLPNIKYHLIKYDTAGKYFIAKNDAANPGEAGLYSRIDIMHFTNMEPYLWGFCLTAYDAKTFAAADSVKTSDRTNPRKGCGGFPFSRMQRDIRD